MNKLKDIAPEDVDMIRETALCVYRFHELYCRTEAGDRLLTQSEPWLNLCGFEGSSVH